jgi:hypothetical protein
MHTRIREYIQKIKRLFLHPTVHSIVLNIVRALSLVSLVLVFSSAIVDLHTNVEAVNAFNKVHDDSALLDCEYLELGVFIIIIVLFFY